MDKAICDYCGKEFDCQTFRIEMKERGERKHLFCNHQCEGAFRKALQTDFSPCVVCGKMTHLKPSYKNKIKNHCCSRECSKVARREWMSGEKNHQYGLKGNANDSWIKDDKKNSYGYTLIRSLGHPFANCDDFVFEHRLIAEKYLLTDENSVEINGKRYLSKDYAVHHLDENKSNNDVSNLVVMTKGDHQRFHRLADRDLANQILAKYTS